MSLRLWDSWEDDAVLGDKAAGVFADPARIHPIEHAGRYFRVRGPAQRAAARRRVTRCWCRRESSQDGRAFAARYAEAIFTAHQTLDDGQEFYDDSSGAPAGSAATLRPVKILPGIVPVIGRTEAEARALADELEGLITPPTASVQLAKTCWRCRPEPLELDRAATRRDFGERGDRGCAEPLRS